MADEKRYDIDEIINELRNMPSSEPKPVVEPAPEAVNEPAEEPTAAPEVPAPKKFELHLDLDGEYGDIPDLPEEEEEESVRIYGEEPIHIVEEEPVAEDRDEVILPAEESVADSEVPVVKKFELHLDLDDEYGDIPDLPAQRAIPVLKEEPPVHILDEEPSASDEEQPSHDPQRRGSRLQGLGCLWATLYGTVILVVSLMLSYTLIAGFLDFTAIGKEPMVIDVTVPKDVKNDELAELLEEAELIDHAWIFKIYAGLVDGEGNWQPGEYSLRQNMGYQTIARLLRTAAPREVSRVTIPEGFTIPQIAQRLEEKKVCTADEFMTALSKDYSKDYDFLADLKQVDAADRKERIHALEGYLFPDTYDFYKGCSGETVVRKMLDNFDSRMTTKFRAAAKEQGLTIDQVVILASIVQGEANNPADMAGVARVFHNRLANPSVFPRLESDATGEYLNKIMNDDNADQGNQTYNTYNRKGLPVGPVNCPGADAIRAVLWPADDDELACTCSKKNVSHSVNEKNGKLMYFFATYYDKAEEKYVTGYHATNEAHSKFCDAYNIHD